MLNIALGRRAERAPLGERSEPLQLQGLCWALLWKLLGVEGMCWNLLASAERRAKRAPFGERSEPKDSAGICWYVLGFAGDVPQQFYAEARFPLFVRQVSHLNI